MAEISTLDLQNLRHLIGGFDTCHCKMQDYAAQAKDPEIKQLSGCGKLGNEEQTGFDEVFIGGTLC